MKIKKRMGVLLFVCVFALSACGKEEAKPQEQTINIEEEGIRYAMKELSLPDSLLSENSQGSDYIGDDFSGFVSDIQGKPAVYYSNVSIESEEYFATITRWNMDEEENWKSEELCENSLSEFLNNKYEQTSWLRCRLSQFSRGDNGNLYAVFTYYLEENQEMDGQNTEMIQERYSLLEIDEENDSIFEIPLEIGPEAVQEKGFERNAAVEWISDYHAFEDGSILVLSSDSGGGYGYLIDGESGQVSQEVGNVVTGKRRFAFGESEILFFSNKINKFQVLSLPDLEEQNTFGGKLSTDVLGKDWYFYMNPDTWELFMCNTSGVYKAESYQNADEVKCLTEKTDMSEIDSGDAEILDFFVGAEEDFYVCMMQITEEYGEESRNYRIVHYEKE